MDVWYQFYYLKLNNFPALTCKDVRSHHYHPSNKKKKAKQTEKSIIVLDLLRELKLHGKSMTPRLKETRESQLTGSRSPWIQEGVGNLTL